MQIAGDGDVAHPSLQRARRLQVRPYIPLRSHYAGITSEKLREVALRPVLQLRSLH